MLYIVFSRGRTVKLKLPPSPVLTDCTGSETGDGDSEASRRTVTGGVPGRTMPSSLSGWSNTTRRVSGPRSDTSTEGRAVAVRTGAAVVPPPPLAPQPATARTDAKISADRPIAQR